MLNKNIFTSLFPFTEEARTVPMPQPVPIGASDPAITMAPSAGLDMPIMPRPMPSAPMIPPVQPTENVGMNAPMDTQMQQAPVDIAVLEEQAMKAMKPKKERAEFIAPYENPSTARERAENERARLQFESQNPTNRDKGVKGFLMELLQNGLYGLSQTKAGMDPLQGLLLAATGAGAGIANRGWNEQRAAEAMLPGATEEVEFLGKQEDALIRRQNTKIDNENQATRTKIAQSDAERKKIKDDRDYEIRSQTFDWKKEDRDRYYELEETKRAAREKNDDRTYDLAVRKQAELERSNGVREKQADTRIGQNQQKIGQAQQKLNLAVQKAAGGGKSAPKKALPKGVRGLTKAQAGVFAQKLDDDFDAGEMSEELYNRRIEEMLERMQD